MKTILITEASRGFGRLWTAALLERGDRVIATSRDISRLKDFKEDYSDTFLLLSLDVTDRRAVFEAIQLAYLHWGSLDVVINNAAYGVVGATEELSEVNVRTLVDVNFLGTLWVTQAVLPYFRSQGSGHIIQVSSVLGLWKLPTLGLYSATKFAIDGLSESLSKEVQSFGINVTLVEPEGYAANFAGDWVVLSKAIPAYDNVRKALQPHLGIKDLATEIPEVTIPAILKLIDTKKPPFRWFLGKIGDGRANGIYSNKL